VCSTVVEGKWEKFGAKASCVEHEGPVETDQSEGERLPDECFAEGLGRSRQDNVNPIFRIRSDGGKLV